MSNGFIPNNVQWIYPEKALWVKEKKIFLKNKPQSTQYFFQVVKKVYYVSRLGITFEHQQQQTVTHKVLFGRKTAIRFTWYFTSGWYTSYTWAALREKVLNVLSLCHTKRRTGTHGHARSSFGMTPTFQKKKKSKKSVSYQKKDGRGHTTMTQAFGDLFALLSPFYNWMVYKLHMTPHVKCISICEVFFKCSLLKQRIMQGC